MTVTHSSSGTCRFDLKRKWCHVVEEAGVHEIIGIDTGV
jgi:hypothetical protein